ncbi:hypothetical protein C8J56DRAFT_1002354 [Mycena floridula]|nr:hypothetical protein C8J56DRAFT_1002354 [Mycena floridula]
MSERKVLNKYFPPDFDPDLIPRRSGPKNSQQVVRLMAPFSMRCNTCGEYIYKGKKFNARKETVDNEDYYGIRIFRFYIKCTLCSAEITFKTDPKNTDYLAEHGASRNFEPWREERAGEEEDRLAKLEEEENNPMKVLENRTTDSKREMDILDALQDIRARNARNERMGKSVDLVERIGLEEVENDAELERKRLEDEDEKEVQRHFSKIAMPAATDSDAEPVLITVKRKAADIEPSLTSLLPEATRSLLQSKPAPTPALKKKKTNGLGIKIPQRLAANQSQCYSSLYRKTRATAEFIEQAFSMAQPNLRVNGRNFENIEEHGGLFWLSLKVAMEPFDEGLDRRIWSLADNRLAWYRTIAETRRKTPQEVERAFVELHQKEIDLENEEEAINAEDGINTDTAEVEEILVQRFPHIQEGFRKTAALAEELNQLIAEQQERSERFEVVAAEVKALKP